MKTAALAPPVIDSSIHSPRAPRSGCGRFMRLKQRIRHALFPATRKVQLPLQGLPAGIGDIHAGGIALLLCADTNSRERLLASLIETAAPGQRITWLCAPSKAPLFMDADLCDAVRSQVLRVLTWREDAATQVRELGATHLLRELLSSGMDGRDLLVVDALEPWLAETPEGAALEAGIDAAMHCLLLWNQNHQGPILALAPTHRRGQSLLPFVARGKVARLATLQVQGHAARLDIIRWGAAHRPGPKNLGARFELAVPERGHWPGRAAADFELHPILTACDTRTVHAMAGALHDAGAVPVDWQTYSSLEALLAGATSSIAATIVLAYEHPDALPVLANAIHRLRHEHPRILRIVVRASGVSMRHNAELALTRLGANVVLRRHLGFAQLEQSIEDLLEVSYSRAPVANPERLLQRLAPDAVQGYLPPLEFCAAVERMLERTADAPLEHSLVHLPLLPHLSHAEALLACAPRRDGDLVSADDQGLHLFFFGCPADDAMATLDSVFSLPCSQVAHHVQINPERHTQTRALAELRRRNQESAADYASVLSSVLSSMPPGPGRDGERGSMQPTVLPTRASELARNVHAHVLPLRAATT